MRRGEEALRPCQEGRRRPEEKDLNSCCQDNISASYYLKEASWVMEGEGATAVAGPSAASDSELTLNCFSAVVVVFDSVSHNRG